jgi:pseudolysin/vibriolysin
MKKGMKLQAVLRPTILASLVAASLSVSAADRIDLGSMNSAKAKTFNSASNNASARAHEVLGLNVGDLKALRSQKYGNKLVTRYEQLHQGVPVWGEVIVEHSDETQSIPRCYVKQFGK